MKTGTITTRPVVSLAAPVEQPGNLRLPMEWTALGAILLASCGHVLIKMGLAASAQGTAAMGLAQRVIHYVLQPEVAAGLAVYGMGTLLWIAAVSRRNISFLYPLTALNYVLVTMSGMLFFGEHLSAGRWTGIAVVVFGVALLQLSVTGEKA